MQTFIDSTAPLERKETSLIIFSVQGGVLMLRCQLAEKKLKQEKEEELFIKT